MLNDWLWAVFLTLCLWLEVGGWARLITRKMRVGTRLTYALGFACAGQVYFVLSLLGKSSPQLHAWLMAIGIVLGLAPRLKARRSRSPRLHLKLARSFSPLVWKRAWPWLALPIAWAILRVIDALIPHAAPGDVSAHLYAPRLWLEQGAQRLDPLHPLAAASSVWDGLTYHAMAIISAFHPVSRAALVRGQCVAQLLQFTAGQCLALVLLAGLLEPFIAEGWNVLAHAEASASYRHRLGLASTVAQPSSLYFAWLACGQSQAIGTRASVDWAAAMAAIAAVAFVATGEASLAVWAAAGWLAGTAAAIKFSWAAATGLGLAAAIAALATGSRLKRLIPALAVGIGAGLAPWLFRNWMQAGSLFSPMTEAGWLSDLIPRSLYAPATSWPATTWVVLATGVPATLFYLGSVRLRLTQPGMRAAGAFTTAGAVVALVTGELPLATGAALVACAGLGLEFLVTFLRRPLAAELGRHIPLFWFAAGLFLVPLPFHLLWQGLPRALGPAEAVLAEIVPHFDAKIWSDLSLPPTSRIAWTADFDFYYLEQPAASIRESAIVHDALARAPTAAERAHALCELGFDVLAWEDHAHGPECSGLASWLRLTRGSVLHVTEDVTFFNLRCH